MDEFCIGDYVLVIMRPDGAVFTGILTDWLLGPGGYIEVNGCGFPHEDVATMEHVVAGNIA